MTIRSAKFRNISGAFLGGMLGILLCGYIHPMALPFGCLVGCIVGYWYDHVWVSAVHAFDIAEGAFGRFAGHPGNTLRSWARRAHRAWESYLGHPVDRAASLRTFASVAFLLLHCCVLVLCIMWGYTIGGSTGVAAFAAAMVAVCFGIMAVLATKGTHDLLSSLNVDKEMLVKMRIFYTAWERYGNGGLRYALLAVADLFRTQLAMFLYIMGSLLWFITAGGLFLLAVVAPVAVAVGFVRGIYLASQKDGYWLCFAATLCTAALSAWLMYPYFENGYVLWVVALATGVASAAATDLARQALHALFAASRTARSLAVVPQRYRRRWVSKGFWGVSNSLGNFLTPGLDKILPPLLR